MRVNNAELITLFLVIKGFKIKGGFFPHLLQLEVILIMISGRNIIGQKVRQPGQAFINLDLEFVHSGFFNLQFLFNILNLDPCIRVILTLLG